MSTAKNLWGELPLAELVRTPVAILREQATQLTFMTGGLLEGTVSVAKSQVPNRAKTPIVIRLSIMVPALDNYVYGVIRCYHSVLLYPISVLDLVNSEEVECADEKEFLAAIEKVLSSAAVHKSIAALLSQSKSEDIA